MPVRPVFLYRADCWAMAKQEEAMVHVIEISILRWTCGVATKDGPVTKHEQQQLWRLFYSGPVCSMYLPFTVNLKVLCYTPLFLLLLLLWVHLLHVVCSKNTCFIIIGNGITIHCNLVL